MTPEPPSRPSAAWQNGADMATLRDLLDGLALGEREESIYAVQPWVADSEALIAPDEAYEVPATLAYMLEVDLAIEAIEVWERWHGRDASADDRCRAVIHYAAHDAYLED